MTLNELTSPIKLATLRWTQRRIFLQYQLVIGTISLHNQLIPPYNQHSADCQQFLKFLHICSVFESKVISYVWGYHTANFPEKPSCRYETMNCEHTTGHFWMLFIVRMERWNLRSQTKQKWWLSSFMKFSFECFQNFQMTGSLWLGMVHIISRLSCLLMLSWALGFVLC